MIDQTILKKETEIKFDKVRWRETLFMELVRKAVLETFDEGPCRSEYEAEILAFWLLLDPWETGLRRRTEIAYLVEDQPEEGSDLPPTPPRIRWLTAHSHPGEPLTPSPDDLFLYDRMDLERGACSHFIMDGIDIRKIR